MKKVAFFLDNVGFVSTDCSNALNGNPGIGGTEWLFIVVSTLLSKRDNEIDIILYITKSGKFLDGLMTKVVRDISEAITIADAEGVDYLVVKHLATNITEQRLNIKTQKLRIICWCHVFVCHWELDYYASNDVVSKIVFVGKEMYDLYRDHRIFNKAVYIYNCIESCDAVELVVRNPYEKRRNAIVYVGSLVPYKGFHLLAEAWPEVLEHFPDAELFVIGSGKLYDEKSKLGDWGIAESEYEAMFMKNFIIHGRLHPNVHFLGLLGDEKKDILLKAKIGVPNPSGITETFCLSAVEMQMYGCRIATINYPGYMDTVKNGTLYSRRDELAKTIIDLLNSSENNYDASMDYFKREFSYESVSKRWEELIHSGELECNGTMSNSLYRLKWLKEMLRVLKRHLPFLYCLPMVERGLIYLERKRKGRVTYIDS